jgi:hypothetical protein
MAAKGIINGTSQDTYNPGAQVTRADFIKLLINTLGLGSDFTTIFEDVSLKDYYYREVGIAKALGIVTGRGNNVFDPKAPITRQEMMTMTAKAMKIAKKIKAGSIGSDLSNYEDSANIATYASESIALLVRSGIVTGSGNRINPIANTTRAEAAVIMYRILNMK